MRGRLAGPRRSVSGARLIALLVLALALAACDSNRIEVIQEGQDQEAQQGRRAYLQAISDFSSNAKSPASYARFAAQVRELDPLLNRELKKEAELRLSFFAIGPMAEQLTLPADEQMRALATTVWPTVLGVAVGQDEGPDAYLRRLCLNDLALDCKNVVPEYWPLILNAKAWRLVKSQAAVAYSSCMWCKDDPTFKLLLSQAASAHLEMELAAKDAQEQGDPNGWPRAGQSASPRSAEAVVSFGRDGWVSLNGRPIPGGDWRGAIDTASGRELFLGLHLAPERMVKDLVALLADARAAGHQEVALMVREAEFPYELREYRLKTERRNFAHLRIRGSDSIQVLVQALDLAASKVAAGAAH